MTAPAQGMWSFSIRLSAEEADWLRAEAERLALATGLPPPSLNAVIRGLVRERMREENGAG
jgi:hypothetical protein